MIDLSTALTDPEMGYGPYTVKRTTYRRRNGDSVPTEQTVLKTSMKYSQDFAKKRII